MIYDFHNKLTYVFLFFYCFPTISRAAAHVPEKKNTCIKSVETVEIINAKKVVVVFVEKMAQRNCFNKNHFHIE